MSSSKMGWIVFESVRCFYAMNWTSKSKFNPFYIILGYEKCETYCYLKKELVFVYCVPALCKIKKTIVQFVLFRSSQYLFNLASSFTE